MERNVARLPRGCEKNLRDSRGNVTQFYIYIATLRQQNVKPMATVLNAKKTCVHAEITAMTTQLSLS